MSFDVKNLKLFIRAATLGAIGRAGAEFNLSSTNATQRIKALEADLGVKLFNRTTRAISLTSDGEIFLEHAKRIISEIEDAQNALSKTTKTVSGHLRVTTSASFARSHIIPFIPAFFNQYPDVTLDLNLTDTIVDIVEQGYDVAFRIGELVPSSLLAQRIDDNPQALVATPEYIAKNGMPETPQDLLHHTCLPLGETRLWRLVDENGVEHETRVDGPLKVNLGDAVGALVLSGMGIGFTALWHSGPDLASGRLVRVLPNYRLAPETKIWAVRPPGRSMPARVKAFLDFMQARIVETNKSRYGDLDI